MNNVFSQIKKQITGHRKILVISDCTLDRTDEGLVKLFTMLIKPLREKKLVKIIGLYRKSSLCDDFYETLRCLKFLYRIRITSEKIILWIPSEIRFYHWWAAALATALLGKKNTFLIAAQFKPFSKLVKFIHQFYYPDVYIAAKDIEQYFTHYKGRIHRIRAGVDTNHFNAIAAGEKKKLREKYSLPPQAPLLLHVGHVIDSRRLDWMLQIPEGYYGVLVVSSFWEKNSKLMKQLEKMKNIILLTEFYPEIHEIYQACDVYVFTPQRDGAINIPLSVFEAMSCNMPVVATRHGELCELEEDQNLRFVTGEHPHETIQAVIQMTSNCDLCTNREKVLAYDWKRASEELYHMLLK